MILNQSNTDQTVQQLRQSFIMGSNSTSESAATGKTGIHKPNGKLIIENYFDYSASRAELAAHGGCGYSYLYQKTTYAKRGGDGGIGINSQELNVISIQLTVGGGLGGCGSDGNAGTTGASSGINGGTGVNGGAGGNGGSGLYLTTRWDMYNFVATIYGGSGGSGGEGGSGGNGYSQPSTARDGRNGLSGGNGGTGGSGGNGGNGGYGVEVQASSFSMSYRKNESFVEITGGDGGYGMNGGRGGNGGNGANGEDHWLNPGNGGDGGNGGNGGNSGNGGNGRVAAYINFFSHNEIFCLYTGYGKQSIVSSPGGNAGTGGSKGSGLFGHAGSNGSRGSSGSAGTNGTP
jgi:hypothetical protein